MKPVVALDWDRTFTLHPPAFTEVAQVLQKAGFRVVIVTMRYPQEAVSAPLGLEVFYTGRRAKEAFLQEQGVTVNVWIDDMPFAIYQDLK